MLIPNQPITCTACGRHFTWSAGEQQFYHERGLQAPRRCPDCRAARRQQTATPAARTSGPLYLPARTSGPRRTPQLFSVATLVAAGALIVTLFILVPSAPLLAWLVAVNLVALLTYGYDKSIAGGPRTRVPEAVLLGLALVGGSSGAWIGMLLFRHKTSKPAFLVPFGLIVALQAGLIITWIVIRESQ